MQINRLQVIARFDQTKKRIQLSCKLKSETIAF